MCLTCLIMIVEILSTFLPWGVSQLLCTPFLHQAGSCLLTCCLQGQQQDREASLDQAVEHDVPLQLWLRDDADKTTTTKKENNQSTVQLKL